MICIFYIKPQVQNSLKKANNQKAEPSLIKVEMKAAQTIRIMHIHKAYIMVRKMSLLVLCLST